MQPGNVRAVVAVIRSKLANVTMTEVFVALGANLAEPQAQILRAIAALQNIPATELLACSPLYSSSPMGPQDQPDYINAVARLQTSLAPHALLDELQRIELDQGRVRKDERWGPRTLDLDILLFGQQVIDDERLTIPHYGMKQRAFVLVPLFDLAPDLTLPDGNQLAELAAACDRTALFRLPE
jgi:2-amino-4-hydroxy-6-hydroxymethyldihydropteridine diphosphokinase